MHVCSSDPRYITSKIHHIQDNDGPYQISKKGHVSTLLIHNQCEDIIKSGVLLIKLLSFMSQCPLSQAHFPHAPVHSQP